MKEEILVLGGGFSGVESAIKLSGLGHKVTLVSNRDYLFIYPISIWIPIKKKTFNDVSIPLEKLSKKHGFELIIDEVEQIITKESKVVLGSQTLTYDYLVIGMGMHKHLAKGLEHTHSICGKPEEAVIIEKEIEKIVKKGQGKIAIGFGSNPNDPSATAVRGGPAFELLFNFSHYFKKKKLKDKIELTFFAPMPEPGKKMGKSALNKMDVMFEHYKIKKQVGKKIKRFEKDAVIFEDDLKLESDLIIFIPGGDGHSVMEKSDLPLSEAGFIKIDDRCKVEGIDQVYAVGDITDLNGPKWAAKQGHIAEVMADVTAYNIHHRIKGSEKRKTYHNHLNIVCVMDSGDGAAFVYRKADFDIILPLPIVGHWLKQAWGFYYKNTKLKKIPRVPGM